MRTRWGARGKDDTVYANYVQSCTEFTGSVRISCRTCVHRRQTQGEDRQASPRSQQAVLKMAIEKQTTHATWTQPPLMYL